MVQVRSKKLTLAEFLELPETKPASEYINGKIIQKPMPKGKHSILQTQLSTTLNAALQPGQIAWAFSELRCTFGGRSTVPDVCVFAWSRIPCDDNGEIANNIETYPPDWSIEILSPEQSQTRVTKNILHCLQCGSQMGWLIDPAEKTVLVYFPPDQVKVFDQASDRLPVPAFAANVKLTVSELFSWLVVRPLS
ncbi:MAG: Uma2 family endonuclease [Cyanobacteria bacterium P01_F01_bin.143]